MVSFLYYICREDFWVGKDFGFVFLLAFLPTKSVIATLKTYIQSEQRYVLHHIFSLLI